MLFQRHVYQEILVSFCFLPICYMKKVFTFTFFTTSFTSSIVTKLVDETITIVSKYNIYNVYVQFIRFFLIVRITLLKIHPTNSTVSFLGLQSLSSIILFCRLKYFSKTILISTQFICLFISVFNFFRIIYLYSLPHVFSRDTGLLTSGLFEFCLVLRSA